MQTINYPILYFQLNESAILGVLVGTEHKVVQTDLKGVQQALTRHLQQLYKKDGEYYDTGILDPQLTTVYVKIRPTHRDRKSFYPAAHQLQVPVPAVYGKNERGSYICYLPLFDVEFHYYDESQFRPLVTHFTNDYLNSKTPQEIYRYLSYQEPQLVTIKLRVNPGDEFNWDWLSFKRELKQLKRLTEPFPAEQTQKKRLTTFPEAAWELEDKVAEVMEKLVNVKANILLVGEHGVGKSAVLRQAMLKIKQQQKGAKNGLTFWRVMAQRLTATAKYFGEWQGNVEELIEELKEVNGILWVEDIVRLLQMGGEGAEDSIAAFLVGFLAQGKLQMVSEVSERELDGLRRLLPGFAEHFQIITLKELSEEKTRAVLRQFAGFASGGKLQIQIEEDSLQLAYQLLKRYHPYESFPGKGLKFLGKVVSNARHQQKKIVDKTDIIQNFAEQTGLPEVFLNDDILLDVKELRKFFTQRIIGQPAAIDQLVDTVKIFKAGLNNPEKPIATMIFAGPTGVGKTASVSALADYFFGKGQKTKPLIRIDMSEYQYAGQLYRFIGSGRQVGELVKKVREQPFSVVLLDEIEKAHPSIFDALLTVLDEGLMVDSFGRVTNFRNTIIIMTSNLGATNRATPNFRDSTTTVDRYRSAIEKHFRPEYVNRIDQVVYFNALQEADIEQITRKELQDFNQREGLRKRKVTFKYTKFLVQYLAQIGYDERYGARMLQRAVDDQLTRFLSNYLLEKPQLSNTELLLDYRDGKIVVVK
ncbi:MAG: AAA family ATPase [Saprospiraceae bacterium]